MSINSENVIEQFSAYLDDKEGMLDAYIDAGSEHDLFIASYIHGHFSVVAANIMHSANSPQNLGVTLAQWQLQTQEMLSSSIEQAIVNNELAGDDASDVLNMTGRLFEDSPT